MIPGIGPLGEAFGVYAVVSMAAIPLALGIGLDERTAGALSIVVGVVTALVLLGWRYLPRLFNHGSTSQQ